MKYQYWSEISFYLNEIDQQKSVTFERKVTPEKLAALRASILIQLNQLKDSLKPLLEEYPTYLILFAIIACIDEEIHCLLPVQDQMEWVPIQQDFYNTSNAGELFYKTLDEILDDPTIPTIVFEVFYFILKRGFSGKYVKSKTKISRYLDFLSEKISVVTTSKKEKGSIFNASKRWNIRPWQWYGMTIMLIFSVYAILYFSSNTLINFI